MLRSGMVYPNYSQFPKRFCDIFTTHLRDAKYEHHVSMPTTLCSDVFNHHVTALNILCRTLRLSICYLMLANCLGCRR